MEVDIDQHGDISLRNFLCRRRPSCFEQYAGICDILFSILNISLNFFRVAAMANNSFYHKGFLSDYVYEFRKSLRLKYEGAFKESEEISDQAYVLLASVSVKETDIPLVCALLFIERSIRSCQAAIRLCEIGLVQEAQVLTRTAYETIFAASALIAKPDIFDKMSLSSDHEDHKFASAIKINVPLDQVSMDSKLVLERFLKPDKSDGFSVYEAARVSGMLEDYSLIYRGLSSFASHASLRSLDRSMKSEDGVYVMQTGPSDEQLVFTLSIIVKGLKLSLERLLTIKDTA